VIHVVSGEQRAETAAKLFPDSPVFAAMSKRKTISSGSGMRSPVGSMNPLMALSIPSPLPTTRRDAAFSPDPKKDFLQAMDISCFSFISIANHFKDLLARQASLVTISISSTRMAAENYGYMGPVKAALESSLCFLPRAFPPFPRSASMRSVPGLLKTSASAGIPGYIESYLFAEQATLRKRAVQTEEAAHVAVFLLSPRSSGMNGQCLVVDAGMGMNYFDAGLSARQSVDCRFVSKGLNNAAVASMITRLWADDQTYQGSVSGADNTAMAVKVVLVLGLLYTLSPYDLIPEWVPVLGVMDDLALAALLIAWANSLRFPNDEHIAERDGRFVMSDARVESLFR
jgi:enoyl-[acyl-carrier protein] reductase I